MMSFWSFVGILNFLRLMRQNPAALSIWIPALGRTDVSREVLAVQPGCLYFGTNDGCICCGWKWKDSGKKVANGSTEQWLLRFAWLYRQTYVHLPTRKTCGLRETWASSTANYSSLWSKWWPLGNIRTPWNLVKMDPFEIQCQLFPITNIAQKK